MTSREYPIYTLCKIMVKSRGAFNLKMNAIQRQWKISS
jgi:hypothetical protein